MKKGAFTLIELLIAFAISTVLAGAIYLFYINFVSVDTRTRLMVGLDRDADLFLEKFYRDLRTAKEIVSLHPNEIVFSRRVVPKGELGPNELSQKIYEQVTYRSLNKNGHFYIERCIGLGEYKPMLQCSKGNGELFRGFVLAMIDEANNKPAFKEFDTVSQSSVDLARIALVAIKLQLFHKQLDKPLIMQSKVFLPNVYASLVEPDWNSE